MVNAWLSSFVVDGAGSPRPQAVLTVAGSRRALARARTRGSAMPVTSSNGRRPDGDRTYELFAETVVYSGSGRNRVAARETSRVSTAAASASTTVRSSSRSVASTPFASRSACLRRRRCPRACAPRAPPAPSGSRPPPRRRRTCRCSTRAPRPACSARATRRGPRRPVERVLEHAGDRRVVLGRRDQHGVGLLERLLQALHLRRLLPECRRPRRRAGSP